MTRFASSFALLTAVAVGGVFAAAGCATEEAAEKKEPVGGATQSEAGLEAKNFFIERVYDNTRGDKTDLKSGCGGCHSGNGEGGRSSWRPRPTARTRASRGRPVSSLGPAAVHW
ncbi:MAG: hypothetical protein IPG50_10645 [Myxococcales bacterium]|nr:hypothetical protein [Myxococcales bacterium]